MGYHILNIITTSDLGQGTELLNDLICTFKDVKVKIFASDFRGVIG